ncbi:MAG: hypothetical protein ACYC9Q_01475 [Bacillota bacterium]
MSRRRRYGSWAQRVEGTLLRATIAACVLLVVAQFLLTKDDARRLLSYVDRLEGVSLNSALGDTPASQTAAGRREEQGPPQPGTPAITLRLAGRRSARLAVVLVNGNPVARFSGQEVTVGVKNGDLLEVDGADYRTELRFVVVRVSGGVAEPAPGTSAATRRNIAVIGRVKTSGP